MSNVKSHSLIAASISMLCVVMIVIHMLHSSAASSQPTMKWLLNGPALSILASDPTAQRFFEHTEPFVVQRKGNPVSLPRNWGAVSIRSFTSYPDIKRALESGSLDSGVRGVLYDNEGWQLTPRDEQLDPGRYMRMAAQLVHARGLLFITAPAVDLTKILSPGAEKRYDAYLRLELAAEAARYADVYEIQAQGSERNVTLYTTFVQKAAQQARAANPRIMVLAGISTNPSGQRVTAHDILRAIEATRSYVAGYWLNVPQHGKYCPGCKEFRPDIALEVIQRLAASDKTPQKSSHS